MVAAHESFNRPTAVDDYLRPKPPLVPVSYFSKQVVEIQAKTEEIRLQLEGFKRLDRCLRFDLRFRDRRTRLAAGNLIVLPASCFNPSALKLISKSPSRRSLGLSHVRDLTCHAVLCKRLRNVGLSSVPHRLDPALDLFLKPYIVSLAWDDSQRRACHVERIKPVFDLSRQDSPRVADNCLRNCTSPNKRSPRLTQSQTCQCTLVPLDSVGTGVQPGDCSSTAGSPCRPRSCSLPALRPRGGLASRHCPPLRQHLRLLQHRLVAFSCLSGG